MQRSQIVNVMVLHITHVPASCKTFSNYQYPDIHVISLRENGIDFSAALER